MKTTLSSVDRIIHTMKVELSINYFLVSYVLCVVEVVNMLLLKVLRLLAAGALRQDFWSFLQLDRKERQLMKFPNDFDNLSVEEQKAVAMFLCNSFSSCKVALSPE